MKFINYKKYLKNNQIEDAQILIGKTSKSYLVGPKIDENFNNNSFYKRIISSSIYNKNIYKRCTKRTANRLISKYYDGLESNSVIEIFNSDEIVKHKIIALPGENNERK